MRLLVRLAVAVVIVGSLVGLGFHYEATAADHSPYPENDDLALNYDAYVGQETMVFGTVQSAGDETSMLGDGGATDESAAEMTTIRVSGDDETFTLRVRGMAESVQPGGVVQVYGALAEDRTIDAISVAVVNPSGSSKLYKYAVSVVGALLVLAVFFRYWEFDRESFVFEVRADG